MTHRPDASRQIEPPSPITRISGYFQDPVSGKSNPVSGRILIHIRIIIPIIVLGKRIFQYFFVNFIFY
jgi:hypothetical protein